MDAVSESKHRESALIAKLTASQPRHCALVVLFYSSLFVAFFSPIIFRGKLLAVGADGLYNFLPNFYSRKVLWDTLVFAGFPMMADPEALTWYPPAPLLSLLPGTWNLFIIVAYGVASISTYGYVYTLTRSWLAATVSGLVFGLSGFMIAHLGHAHIIHSAAWVPLVIWSLESLRQKLTAKWFVVGSIGFAFTFLGGQPQIFVYGLMLSIAYAITIGWNAPTGRWKYYLTHLLMIVLGVGLAAIQIVPTIELVSQGTRLKYSFTDFVFASLPPRQALNMIFPLVFGSLPQAGGIPYFGGQNQTELTGYVGLVPLVLAVVGVIKTRRKGLVFFWACAALLAFALAMGPATPLARLIDHVPILNGFRAPARHFFEFTMAVSVMSGLGVAAIFRPEVSPDFMRKIIVIVSLAMIACVILLFMNSRYIAALAAQQHITKLKLAPWANSAVGVPLMIFLMGVSVLIFWHKKPTSMLRLTLLLSILIIDLASFGWFYEWRYAALAKNDLAAPEADLRYRNLVIGSNQRVLPFRGPSGSVSVTQPNLSRLWGVPNVSGYNALILSRTSHLLGINERGDIEGPLWHHLDDASFNIMAVRYFFLPPHRLITEAGFTWFTEDMQQSLGSGCGESQRNSFTLTLPSPFKSNALGVVSRLACSSQVPDGTEVARVRLTDANGRVQTRSLLAGRDSSEWAYDCGSVKPHMRHQRANVFSNYPAKMYDEPCDGHFYVTRLALDEGKDIRSIEIERVGNSGSIIIEKVSLESEKTGSSYPIDPALINPSAWQLVEETQEMRAYENLRTMPRAWLVPEVVTGTADQTLNAIKTSTLTDGRRFDPARTALVEESLAFTSHSVDDAARATVTTLSNTRMEVHTSSGAAAFLITSDAYYPGWRASIDGQDTQLYRADYAIRGVIVPAGEHSVRFDYRPRSFYFGAVISLLSIITLTVVIVGSESFRKRVSRKSGVNRKQRDVRRESNPD